MHLLSKMRDYDPNDSDKSGGHWHHPERLPCLLEERVARESEIRRNLLESDLLEGLWLCRRTVLQHGHRNLCLGAVQQKELDRKGKVQLINGVHLYRRCVKALGKNGRTWRSCHSPITRTFGTFEAVEPYESMMIPGAAEMANADARPTAKKAEKNFGSKIFESHEFGYRRITVERPLTLGSAHRPTHC